MKQGKKWLILALAFSICSAQVPAYQSSYLTQEEYEEASDGILREDMGIVLENHPDLGYLVYRNRYGRKITAYYYSNEMVVEKTPYYEQEDKIGYIDELFPYFGFDPRDTTISNVQAGDNIYLRTDKEGYITYISATTEYTMRYGKVHTWTMGAEAFGTLILEDTNGRLYTYRVTIDTPISKGGAYYTLGRLKEGEWIKVLVSQGILGEGIIEERLMEIVVDPDTRIISNVYRGELIDANKYQNTVTLRNSQTLGKSGWSMYDAMKKLSTNPKLLASYYLGKPVSFDYLASQLRQTGAYSYVAVENYMGREQAVKVNVQTKKQTTLPTTTVIYAGAGEMQLLTGERIMLADDTILVRDNRLVGPSGVVVGDLIQAVVTGENKLAYGRILDNVGTGELQVFRGRVKEVGDYEVFEVETFSLLQDNEWYFHPVPRTFAIDGTTKLYNGDGLSANGIKDFVTYGETSVNNNVYTIIAEGDKAVRIYEMPYTKEAVRGVIYATENGIQMKDIYTYDRVRDRWIQAITKNTTVTLEELPNAVIIKNGKVVSARSLEKGDTLTIMLEDPLNTKKPADAGDTTNGLALTASGYIIIAE